MLESRCLDIRPGLAKCIFPGLRIERFFLIEFGEHPIGPVFGRGDGREVTSELIAYALFANERLGTISLHSLGAVKVVVTLLGFARDETSARSTSKQSTIDVRLEVWGLRFRLAANDVLDFLKNLIRDKRFVGSFILLTGVANDADIDRVLKDPMPLRANERFAISSNEAEVGHDGRQAIEGVVAFGIELEGLGNEWAALRIGMNCFRKIVVEVSDRRHHRPNAACELLSLAASDVFREVVNVVLGLTEHDGKIEFSSGRQIEVHDGKPQGLDLTAVDEMDDTSGIEGVSRQAVRMPCENALHFTLLNSIEHRVEHRSTRFLGGLLLFENINDREPFA